MIAIEDFAEKLLFGDKIEDKLYRPDAIQFGSFSAVAKPKAPGRPSDLQFSKERLPFPKDFSEDSARGTALQFFANHELLAIELMALCLLRFPDLPTNFQRGLVHIISEEQSHLEMYLQRAEQLGIHSGAVPVNSFFWDCLSSMRDPMDFIVGMGLTFEQANLDHCQYYHRLFSAVEDHESASILEQVYSDELRHVKHGLHWFRKWKPPEQADFFAHERRLSLPLSPMRAKGLYFDVSGRRQIGFAEDYIQELQLYSISKGRPSDVYLFRPNCELDQIGQEPKKIAQQMERMLAPLMIFLAQKDDIVVSETLPASQLRSFQQVGIHLPQFVDAVQQIEDRVIGSFRPWGWSEKIAEELGVSFPSNQKQLYGKSWGAACLRSLLTELEDDFLCPLETVGRECFSVEDIQREGKILADLGYVELIVKANFGTAGRGSKRQSFPFDEATLRWCQKTLELQGSVVVEPRLRRLIDYSVQLQIQGKKIKQITVGRFDTSEQGQYLGHYLGPFQRGLDRELLRFLHGDGKDRNRFRRVNTAVVQLVGQRLLAEGFQGSAGIDAFIYRDRLGRYLIRPIVEVNPRVTMGRIAFEAGRYVHSKSQGYFRILPSRSIHWRDIVIEQGRWRRGVVPLTNPRHHMVAILDIDFER